MIWLAALAALLYLYAQFVEPRWFRIRRVQIRIRKKLSRPISILHLSDTHFTAKNAYKEPFYAKLAGDFHPDFVFLTGDIIDCTDGIEPAAKILSSIKANVGKFAVLGNHDYYDYHIIDNLYYHVRGRRDTNTPNDISLLRKKLEESGFRVLVNNNQKCRVDDGAVLVAGTDDPITQEVDFQKTLAGISADSINILLTHSVESLLEMPKDAPVDAVFSGHTHGGQVRVPAIGGYMIGFTMPRSFLEGVNRFQGVITCGSRGLGASRTMTPRFFCRPEALWVEIYGLA